MSRRRKALERFLSKPADFTFNEMRALLEGSGYREIRAGLAGGSRAAFFHEDQIHINVDLILVEERGARAGPHGSDLPVSQSLEQRSHFIEGEIRRLG